MKRMLLTGLAIGVTLSSIVQAATSSSQTTGSNTSTSTAVSEVYEYLKQSPMSLSYLLDAAVNRKDKTDNYKIQGIDTVNIITAGYKINDLNKITWENRWDRTFISDQNDDTVFNRSELQWKRSKILNEKDHGLNLASELKFRYVPESDSRLKSGSDGLVRPGVVVDKTIDSFSISSVLRYAQYIKNTSAIESQNSAYINWITVPSYAINDSFSVGMTFDYIRYFQINRPAGEEDTNFVDIYGSTSYTVNPQVSVELYGLVANYNFVETEFNEDWQKRIGWGALLVLSAF